MVGYFLTKPNFWKLLNVFGNFSFIIDLQIEEKIVLIQLKKKLCESSGDFLH